MFYLYHKDDLAKGKKHIYTTATGKEFDKYIHDNIHRTNFYEFIMKTDSGVNQELGSYMGANL